MKFAKIIFWAASIWGMLVLTPLYFMFNIIGTQDPPPITHPAFYYGFIGAALAWQVAFMIIATDPVRFRPIIIAAILEKFSYALALTTLYMQNRLHRSDLVFAGADLVFGILFVVAFLRTRTRRAG